MFIPAVSGANKKPIEQKECRQNGGQAYLNVISDKLIPINLVIIFDARIIY